MLAGPRLARAPQVGVFGVRVQIRRACGSPEGAVLCTAAKLASDPNNPTQEPGSPFLCLLFFGEAKESESPAAATERHRNVSTRQLQFTSKLSGRATRKRERAFSGSEHKFPEPAARPSGASLRCAAKLRSDPKNHSSVLRLHCDNSPVQERPKRAARVESRRSHTQPLRSINPNRT